MTAEAVTHTLHHVTPITLRSIDGSAGHIKTKIKSTLTKSEKEFTMHDIYYILKDFLFQVNPELQITDALEDVYTEKNVVAIKHQFVRDNRYEEATVLINQDHDNKELASFLLSAEITRSRLAPKVVLTQSRMQDGIEVLYANTYLVKFDVLSDEIVGLEQEDGTYVTPHSLNIQINITKIKEEIL